MKSSLKQIIKFSAREFKEKMKKVNLMNFHNFKTRFPKPISLRCPYCGELGVFEGLISASSTMYDASINEIVTFGIRRCPNPQCKGIIFLAGFIDIKTNSEEIFVFPVSVPFDFNKAQIPPKIAELLEESIECYSNGCYIASAIMIRRTLEEICATEGAEGDTLEKRIDNLKGKVVLPQKLFKGLHNLRLMGNDAAHVKSKNYDKIGEKEVKVAIEFTRELLKALYQYDELLAELEKLKKKPNSDKGA